MTQTTYQAALGTIRGMCNIPTEMPHLALVKRIGAIALIVDGALDSGNTAQETPNNGNPAKVPSTPAQGRFTTFWESLRPDDQEYLLSVFDTAGTEKYLPADIPVGPTNIGPMHKCIKARAAKAKVEALGDEGANGNRRWFLTPGFYSFLKEHKKALQLAWCKS